MQTVSFHTLGCKLNFSETSTIARHLKDAGWQKVAFNEPARVAIINTCSVTENADRECRSIVNRVLAVNPVTFVVIVGCYAQLKPEAISSIPGVDLVLGAMEKFNIISYLHSIEKRIETQVMACNISDANTFVSAYSSDDRTRVFLKVQDGCDYSCSFCTIPLARGKSRSNTVQDVVQQAEEIASSGAKEIVLTGVNLGDFKNGSIDFYQLIQELDKIRDVQRFRISSIEPNLLTEEIISFVARSKKFVPHFHIPLQSGSDKILKLMRRRYQRNLYAQRVSSIKSYMPQCCIGADVIVGFPGETEEDFLETYQFINQLDVSYLHVFTYSERDNTHAINLEGIVPMDVRKKRNKMLRILSDKKLHHFYQQQLGTTVDVLFEADCKNELMHGFSPNYVKVKTTYDYSLINQIIPVHLKHIDTDISVIVSRKEVPAYIDANHSNDKFCKSIPVTYVGVTENNPLSDIQLSPNPTTDILQISIPGLNAPINISLTDISGKEIINQIIDKATTSLSLRDISLGVYFVRFNFAHQSVVKKIIKL